MRVSSSVLAPAPLRDPHGLTPAQKLRAEQLTSLFENSTVQLQYGYTEALHDGRGLTAGRAGFTSGTGDLLEVVQLYAQRVPHNALARYLPALTTLAKAQGDSTRGLEGFAKLWAEASKDPRFRKVQDDIVDRDYFLPSQKLADATGLRTPLARAVLYDTIIQHGAGSDPDGLPAILAKTKAQSGGTPASGVDEKKWLTCFLAARRSVLAHASDPTTRVEWAGSVNRVDALASIAQAGNYELRGPIRIHAGDFQGTIP